MEIQRVLKYNVSQIQTFMSHKNSFISYLRVWMIRIKEEPASPEGFHGFNTSAQVCCTASYQRETVTPDGVNSACTKLLHICHIFP